MKKKLSIIITALILSILAAGCSVEIHEDPGKQDAKYYLYDISSDETQGKLLSGGDNCRLYA